MEQNHPLIFSLDTCSKVKSMAVSRGERTIASFGAEVDGKRSERLWHEAGFLLEEIGLVIKDIDLFSVCVGPGGFTGLRVGIAAAKGMAAATSRPMIGVTSLEAAAFAAFPASRVCSMVGAYKGEVYWQLFSFDESGAPVEENSPAICAPEKVIEQVSHIKDIVFAGDGLEDETIRQVVGNVQDQKNARDDSRLSPKFLADQIARLSFLKYTSGKLESPQTVRACYVRPAQAEIKLSLGLLGSKIRREAGRE